MKNLFIAILIGIILLNGLGALADNLFDLHIVMADELLGPLESMLVVSLIAAVLVVVGFVVAVSVFGALAIAATAGIIGIVAAGVGLFWPVLLIAGVIVLFNRRSSGHAH